MILNFLQKIVKIRIIYYDFNIMVFWTKNLYICFNLFLNKFNIMNLLY